MIRARKSPRSPCSVITSSSCAPIRSEGLSAEAGSCGTYGHELAPALRNSSRPSREHVGVADADRACARCASRALRGRAGRPRPSSCPTPIRRRARRSRRARARGRCRRRSRRRWRSARRASPLTLHDGHASSPPPTPATARETPSVMKFVPIAKRAMQSAGARTAHGWSVIPARFSLIIRPQSAFGG